MLVIALPAAAKTWHVDDNGAEYPDTDYTRISDAIAASSDGDTINVYAGTYNERLKIEKRLTLEGVGQPVIDAGGVSGGAHHDNDGVHILASGVVLRGFKITHTGSLAFGVSVGTDNLLEDIEGTIIEDNLIDRCYEGVWFTYGSTGSILRRNTISNMGGWVGLYDCGSGNNMVYLNSFINNPNGNIQCQIQNEWSSPVQMTYIYQGTTYTGYMGNYWDDYDGADNDGDGIGDTPYTVWTRFDGVIDTDDYPLMEPFENYAAESGYPMIGDINGDGITGVAGAMQDAMHLLKYSCNDPGYPGIFDCPDCNGDGITGVVGAMQDTMHLLKYSCNDPGYPELYPGL
jgi:nitrous oxidase accessory protein NosD